MCIFRTINLRKIGALFGKTWTVLQIVDILNIYRNKQSTVYTDNIFNGQFVIVKFKIHTRKLNIQFVEAVFGV